MTRYVDWGDLANRYRDATKDWDSERASHIIDDAEGEVDARLAPVYTVPFVPGSSNVPQIVRTLSVDLAYYRMIWASDRADKLKEYIDQRFDALLAGSMSLVTSGTVLATNEALAWTDKNYRSAFGPDDPVFWSVSSAAQYDAQQERAYD